jgi:glycerophosphoryl diester phosphodiesterase
MVSLLRGNGPLLRIGHRGAAAVALSEQSPGTGLLVDVKGGGFERELVEALRRHDLVGKAVAATNKLGTLEALQRLEPGLARSRTYPPGRLHVGGRRTFVPIVGPLRLGMRSLLPSRVEALVGEAEVSAMTLDHRLVTRAVVERCHSLGVAVLAWTVNDRSALRKLDLLGVDGVITDDPRIF